MRTPCHRAALTAALVAACTATGSVTGCASGTAADRPASGPTLLSGAPDRFVSVPGARLRYREIGDPAGEPVILLHGYTDRLEMFEGLADSIARDHRVIVPDLRGFGESTKHGSPGDFGARMVDDVVALVDSLGLDHAHLLGYSMGGAIAAQVALREPSKQRVASLSLIAGAFWEDSAATMREMQPPIDALARGEGLAPFMRWILPDYAPSVIQEISAKTAVANDSASVLASARSFHELALDWRAVDRSRVPAVVLVSRRDPMVTHSRLVAARWPGARYVEIADGDHAVVTTLPEVLEEFRRIAALATARAYAVRD